MRTKEKKLRKKRAVTLIEMIVVMLLIATITGALAYNYNSSLNEGKVFKSREGINRIKTILAMAIAENDDKTPDEVINNWKWYVEHSPMAGKGAALTKDGWGEEYQVRIENIEGEDQVVVQSRKLDAYDSSKKK